ncbi:tRNA nucleotidyltransferase [Hydrogenimonas sp.]|nr:tRNA nucleotidyltransferase [Hydrogenimonas sp.]
MKKRLQVERNLPPKLGKQLDRVESFFKKEYPGVRLFLVGGAVRDMIMKRPVYDLDIECFGIDTERFEEAMARLGAKGVGKSFFVYKYGDIDIALPRTEKKVAAGHRGFKVSLAKDTEEASRRRDFTMNALMLDLESGELVDHWGGVEDIKKRIIRVVDPERFTEDSLRVLRAMQFAARLKFRVEERSRALMCTISFDDLSGERIFWEFEKMFNSPNLHYGLFEMSRLGIDEKIFGFSLGRRDFFRTARHMVRAAESADIHMRPYVFLYILACDLHKNPEKLCEKIHTPGIYRKVLRFQKCVPSNVTDRFLGSLALRYALKQWIGIYADELKKRASALGVYDKRFDPGIRPADLLEEGYAGKELGLELRRRTLAVIRGRFSAKAES